MDVADEMRIACKEMFGPIISATPFDDIEEVLRRGNRTPFGLGSGVGKTDVRKRHQLAQMIKADSVWFNCYNAMDPAVPLSGYGRKSSMQYVKEYFKVKTVWIKSD